MTIYGWDSSHFDAVPDTAFAVSEGFSFFTHKAGGDADDSEIAAWWAGAKGWRSRALMGAYWVLYPGSPNGRANDFVDRLDQTCPGWRDGPFILQVDCEEWNSNPATVPPKSDITSFCNRLRVLAPKLTPIVYAPEWVYGDKLTGLGYPLWASRYVSGSGAASKLYPGDSSSRWDPYSGQTPAVLQFTSSATIAGQTTCDANAYRGTLAELTALAAPGWEVDMTTLDDSDAVVVWAHDSITNPRQRADSPLHTPPGTNPAVQAGYALGDAWARIYDLRDTVDALTVKVDALSVQQLPADLAQAVADLVLAELGARIANG